MDTYIEGYISGHKTYTTNGKDWFYKATKELVTQETIKAKPCIKCNLPPTTDGHDACIANLPGVEYACCGHGIEDYDYVKLFDGRRLRLEEYYKEFNIEK